MHRWISCFTNSCNTLNPGCSRGSYAHSHRTSSIESDVHRRRSLLRIRHRAVRPGIHRDLLGSCRRPHHHSGSNARYGQCYHTCSILCPACDRLGGSHVRCVQAYCSDSTLLKQSCSCWAQFQTGSPWRCGLSHCMHNKLVPLWLGIQQPYVLGRRL
jgi:hypothetical protein